MLAFTFNNALIGRMRPLNGVGATHIYLHTNDRRHKGDTN